MTTTFRVTTANSFGQNSENFSSQEEAIESFKSAVINTVANSNCERINYITDVNDYWNTFLSDDRTIEQKKNIEKKYFEGEGFYLNGQFVQGPVELNGPQSCYTDNNDNCITINSLS